jgi:tetratricopeptide (TPR) repeat protein
MKFYKNKKANKNLMFVPLNRLNLLYFLLVFYLSSICNYSSAQTKAVDSLNLIIKNAKHDTIRMRILNEMAKTENDDSLIINIDNKIEILAKKNLASSPTAVVRNTCLQYRANTIYRKGLSCYRQSDYSKAIEYYNQSLKIREEISDKIGISYSLNSIGLVYSNQGDYAKAIDYYNKSLKISTELKNKSRISTTLYNIGIVYYNQGDIPKALENYNKSLKIDKELGDKGGISFSLNTIGVIYYNQGDIPKAIEYFNNSLKILEEIGDKRGISNALVNFGMIYSEQDDFIKALEYFNKSLKILNEIGDKNGISLSLNNVGIVYSELANEAKLKHDDKGCDSLINISLDNYNKSMKICEEIGDKSGISASLNGMGQIYFSHKQYNKSIEYFNKSLKLSEELGDKSGISASLNNLGKIYLINNETQKALSCAQRAYNLTKETGYVQDIKSAAKLLEEIYAKQGNYKLSRLYFGEYIAMSDSMKKDENQKLVQQKYFQYQYEKQASIDSIANSKAMEIKNIELGRQIAESKKQKIIIVFVVLGLIFIAIVAVFIFRSLRITRKQKNIIQDQKQMVDEKNFMLNQQNEEISTQRDEITAQRDLVTLQKEEIEFIHNEVSQSINYATRLQSAILPGFEIIKDFVSDHFVLYKPKDKVSGDFYWWSVVEDHLIIAVADCTGHGVPGAFMSMLGTSFLREIVVKEYMTNPGIILKRLRKEIIHTLKQKGTAGEQKDGMDMALIAINKDNLESLFAGANNPLYLLRNGELIEIKGDKMPISIHLRMEPFKNNNIKLEKGDCLYLFTDGFADQFGGPKNRKFMYKQFKDILLLNCNKPMSEQKEIIESAFDNWRGEGEQIDDVTVVGIKI